MQFWWNHFIFALVAVFELGFIDLRDRRILKRLSDLWEDNEHCFSYLWHRQLWGNVGEELFMEFIKLWYKQLKKISRLYLNCKVNKPGQPNANRKYFTFIWFNTLHAILFKLCFPKRKFVRYRADEILTLFVKDFTTVLRAKSKNQPHHTAMPAWNWGDPFLVSWSDTVTEK